MSRKYLNNRWCVRCGRNTATPYLKKNTKLFPVKGNVLDIGCGNGRNSNYMIELGYNVDSIDMVEDFGIKCELSKDPLPYRKYNIILANYILMFLNKINRHKVMKEINERSNKDTILMIEMYPAKDAHHYNFDKITDYFLNKEWIKLRKSKDRCILKKGNTNEN